MSDDADTSMMESPGRDAGFRGGGIVWTSTQTGTETINDILKYSSKSAHRSRRANTSGPQVELSSTNTFLLKGPSSSVPYLYAASPHSLSSLDSAIVATPPSCIKASSGSALTSSSSSSRTSYSTTCSSTPSLKPQSNGSSTDLKRIRPSQRRAFLEATATTEPSNLLSASIEEKEHINRYSTHGQVDPGVETPMHPIDSLDTLHRMLQSVSKSWSASNASSSTGGTRSRPGSRPKPSKLPPRVVTPVPSTSKTLLPKGSIKAPLSSSAATQQTMSAKPVSLPSRSLPPNMKSAIAGMETIENPLKEAVAKLESPGRIRPRKSIGNNLMPPPPPPLKPLPSQQQPHHRSTSACDLSASDMSFEFQATEPQIESPCKSENELEQSHRPVKNGDVKDAEDSYDDLSFVDVDGFMDVDLEERSSSSPEVEQHVPCTTHESKTVPPSQPALSNETQKLTVAGVVQESQHLKPLIKRETFSSIFSTPIQVTPFAPSVYTPKALGMRRVHSGPVSGHKAPNSSAPTLGAKSGTAPPFGHSSPQGPKPFKVPWARNDTSVTSVEPSAVPGLRKLAPKRRGVMDLDTSVDSSFSFDDMDPEEVEQLLSQIGA